jgi:hypothetical protein
MRATSTQAGARAGSRTRPYRAFATLVASVGKLDDKSAGTPRHRGADRAQAGLHDGHRAGRVVLLQRPRVSRPLRRWPARRWCAGAVKIDGRAESSARCDSCQGQILGKAAIGKPIVTCESFKSSSHVGSGARFGTRDRSRSSIECSSSDIGFVKRYRLHLLDAGTAATPSRSW